MAAPHPRTLGLALRQIEERARLGHALAALPWLDRALAAGELSFSAVRGLTHEVAVTCSEACGVTAIDA